MASRRDIQLTRQIGVHLTIAKLGRLGYIASICPKNDFGHDLLILDEFGNSLPAQVRVINGGSWQFQITKFLNMDVIGDMQYCSGERELEEPNLLCIYVKLSTNENSDFYIFHLRDLQEICFQQTPKSRFRPKNPKSLHSAVRPIDLQKYKENWGLLKMSINQFFQER